MADFEITIIGAGVVGLAMAERLSSKHKRLLLVEKNERYGMETSSRNSEVIHAGIYYKPGSLKAQLCVEGREMLYELCQQHDIPHRQITKIISATTTDELPALERIAANASKNGVQLQLLEKKDVEVLEPHIRTVGGLFSQRTGIISVHQLMDYFYNAAVQHGAIVQMRCEVVNIEFTGSHYKLHLNENGSRSTITSEIIINAAGLHADTIAEMAGIDIDSAGYRLMYAKGSYFSAASSKAKLISRLVYPVPQNEGLGVHTLIDLGGRLKFGPDVEYLPTRAIDYKVDENKRHNFGEAIRRLIPSIADDDISPDMAGIRPKLQKPGEPEKDFVIVDETRMGLPGLIDLIGIESPGLTSSPAIAKYVENLLH